MNSPTVETMREHSNVRIIYFVSLTLLALLLLWAAYVLFVPVFLGFLIAFLSAPVVKWLERNGMARGSASMVLFAFTALAMVVASVLLIPALQGQVEQIQQNQQEYVIAIEDKVTQLRIAAEKILPQPTVQQIETKARAAIAQSMSEFKESIPHMLAEAAHFLSTMIFVPIIAFFFLIEGADVKKWVVRMLPNRYFEMSLMLLHQVNSQLGGYVRGQFLDCVINGILYAIGLSLLGVKGAPVIGAFAGLLNAVPYVGPILGALPGMFSLMIDPSATMPWWSAGVLFFVVHMFDNVMIYPMTVGKSLHLPPFAVILGILFGGSVAGIPGMIVTVPLMGMARQTFGVLHSSLKSYRII